MEFLFTVLTRLTTVCVCRPLPSNGATPCVSPTPRDTEIVTTVTSPRGVQGVPLGTATKRRLWSMGVATTALVTLLGPLGTEDG